MVLSEFHIISTTCFTLSMVCSLSMLAWRYNTKQNINKILLNLHDVSQFLTTNFLNDVVALFVFVPKGNEFVFDHLNPFEFVFVEQLSFLG